MYNQFFGLQKAPFCMRPDPELLYLCPQHREALAGLIYALLNRKEFIVLIGDVGTGKTTLLSKVLSSVPSGRMHASVILNPTLTPSEFLELALMEFGITEIPESKAQRLVALKKVLVDNDEAGRPSVLIIDEAHKLSPAVLEEVRFLSNFGLIERGSLQVVLSGQNELGDLLNQNEFRQLKQRVAVRLTLHALASSDVAPYIHYRWSKCSGNGLLPFTPEAVNAIALISRGIPRVINTICDNALTSAFGQGIHQLHPTHIMAVVKDLDLNVPVTRTVEPVRAPESPPAGRLAPAIGPIRLFDSDLIEQSRPSRLSRWTRRLGLVD
jgi:general secretion pathway protein A